MKTFIPLFALALFINCHLYSQDSDLKESKVDFDAYENLVKEVKEHREKRLIPVSEFNNLAKEKGVIILDTRPKYMYDQKHITGAIHLNFSDFTQEKLLSLIPNTKTKILIYCNNNIDDDPIIFPTKSFTTKASKKVKETKKEKKQEAKSVTLALNIPTYINLYGYGYKNVYELSQLVSIFDSRLEFEGSQIN